jgi:hypothetical protein
MSLLRRLFGIGSPEGQPQSGGNANSPSPGLAPESRATGGELRSTKADRDDVVRRYFELSAEIEEGKRDRDYDRAIRAARATYAILPAAVRELKREYGAFDISTSHAVHTAPKLMAVMEQPEGIHELRAVLQSVRELRDWLPAADEAEADAEAVPPIMAAIQSEPGVLQSALKTRLPPGIGERASNLAAWLEKAGRIMRVKKGSSYQLYPAGYAFPATTSESTAAPLVRPGSSSRPSDLSGIVRRAKRPPRAAKKAHVIDFSGLPVVRLPRAPASWEASEAKGHELKTGEALSSSQLGLESPAPGALEASGKASREPRFTVDGAGWSIVTEEKLEQTERPDPAFRDAFHTARFTHWLDPKGKRQGFETAPSVLRVTGRDGAMVAERGLAHDVYRSDVNPEGTGILFLSRDGVIHGYTETLTTFIEERLADLPEYEAQARRFGIQPRDLKNHTRCVAISGDRSRYLVTIVDEAWCLDVPTGQIIWGFRMPSKEGWTRHVAQRSERVGSSAEVVDALTLMGLELPVTPADVTRQYRVLAMRWHPDRNPGDPNATARFQQLGGALELLTGADLSGLSERQIERVTYEQMLSTTKVSVPDGRGGAIELSISMVVGESFASDWIYAANLGRKGRAFLAGYSGKVVVVSPDGVPELAYDIGAVPRHIVDAGDRLYIVTDTRLYVVAGDRLDALVDVSGASDVIACDNGFALLEPKSVTWFTAQGQRVGSVRSKHPIRRALSSGDGLVVETRQHRAVVAGAPPWWT